MQNKNKKSRKNKIKKPVKISYRLSGRRGILAYDIAPCLSKDCITPCVRREEQGGYYAEDFSKICKDYRTITTVAIKKDGKSRKQKEEKEGEKDD